jgi:hypothetical protein
VPEGAANVNVQGRHEVGALQGFGQLWQKTYRVRLTGADVRPEEVVKVWKEHFPEFQPPNSRFHPSMGFSGRREATKAPTVEKVSAPSVDSAQ